MTRRSGMFLLLAPFTAGRLQRAMDANLEPDGTLRAPDGSRLGWASPGNVPEWISERVKDEAFDRWGRWTWR